MIEISHKIEILPNNKQRTCLVKAFGCARFAYNWGLSEWIRRYKNGEKVNGNKLKKIFNSEKKEKYPFVFETYIKTKPHLGLVDFIYADPDNGNQFIANMYAQDTYGYDGKQYTDYDAFRTCCKSIVKECRLTKCMGQKLSVAMPYKIASDRGGADWDKIMDILLEVFTDVDLTLYKL